MLERLANLYNLTIDTLLSSYTAENTLPANVDEEPPSAEVIKRLPRQEQTLLRLFSQLSSEDKDDFMDLLSIKLRQTRKRKDDKSSKEK